MLYALIPVKNLDGAKTRLTSVLDGAVRRNLVVAMYRDVLAATLACESIDAVGVVSRDTDVASIAEAARAEAMAEAGGLNESLTAAARKLAARGAERLLVLAADLPLANAGAIERVARSDADVALVPSGDGGTNALLLSPGAIDFLFGPDSAARHVAAAEAAGLRVVRLDEPSLTLDVDQPDDLELLRRSSGVGQHTLFALQHIGSSSMAERH